MRALVIVLSVLILGGCKEDIYNPDGNWSRLIFETSDIGSIAINKESNPTVAFRGIHYNLIGVEGTLVSSEKETFNEFTNISGQVFNRLIPDGEFVFGGVDQTNVIPKYGLKVMSDEFDGLTFFHENVEKGFFLSGNDETFYGLLRSPAYLGATGALTTEVQIITYNYGVDFLDTLGSYKFSVENLSVDQTIGIEGFIDNNQIFFHVQSQLFRYNIENQDLVAINLDNSPSTILHFNNQVVVHFGGYKLIIYNKDLSKENEIDLIQASAQDDNLKKTVLKVFTRDDKLYYVTGISAIKKIKHDYSAEIPLSVDLLVIDNNWNIVNNFQILEGIDNDGELLWQKYKLIAEDVRRGRFAVFLFQSKLNNSKYEYLVRRVNFE